MSNKIRESTLIPIAYLNEEPITRKLILKLIEKHDFIYSQAMLFDYLLRLKALSSQKKPIRFAQIINWQIMSQSEWNNHRKEIFLKYGFDKKALKGKREITTKKKEVKSLLKEKMIENILSQLRQEE